jgi:hypothetical protein
MFTDKAKEKFEDYYTLKCDSGLDIDWFYSLPLSMQWGVIIDFADDLGYDLDVMQWVSKKNNHYESTIRYVNDSDMFIEKKHKTRNEARLECIKELNNLINKD